MTRRSVLLLVLAGMLAGSWTGGPLPVAAQEGDACPAIVGPTASSQ